jgi:chorismate mutase
MWQLSIEMKRRFPNIPMLCDPSHICGNRTFLKEIAQKSIDLDYDGLMLESHVDPDNAWSDAKQQITPSELASLLNSLIWRKVSAEEPASMVELRKIRENIDYIDDELIELLAQRMQLSDQIGALKRQNNITILQTERWNNMLLRLEKKALQRGLSKDFFKKYFEAVHFESINHQNNVMNEN